MRLCPVPFQGHPIEGARAPDYCPVTALIPRLCPGGTDGGGARCTWEHRNPHKPYGRPGNAAAW